MALEAVAAAERALSHHLGYLARAIDDVSDKPALSFTVEEEQAIEDRLNEAIKHFKEAITDADEGLLEVVDTQKATASKMQLEQYQDLVKSHVISVRKTLAAYRQRAQGERLKHARATVMQKTNSTGDRKSSTASGSAVDVMAALKRTHRVMAEELDRVGSVTKVLDDGRVSLKSSHQEFDSVNAEIAEVRKRLKALQWQAQQDRMWIAAGIAVLASTVLYIMHQRTGLLII